MPSPQVQATGFSASISLTTIPVGPSPEEVRSPGQRMEVIAGMWLPLDQPNHIQMYFSLIAALDGLSERQG